ncbi:MAG: hypothetical protein FJ146_17280 [Deltaproteobacteria bacterium]|nr:hypothetical protein [Deltaproteobacteria bacterium]
MYSVNQLLNKKIIVSLFASTLGLASASCGTQAEMKIKLAGSKPDSKSADVTADDELAGLALTSAACSNANNLNAITVSPSGSLFINDIAVVNDSSAKGRGPLSFAFLMREILELNPNPGTTPKDLAIEDAAIKSLLDQFVVSSPVNTFVAPSRTNTKRTISAAWQTVTGTDDKAYLSLERAPFKLLAITNRLDIVKKGKTSVTAGEGRFIFGFTGPSAATIILEYNLPIGGASSSGMTMNQWAKDWQGLKQFLVDTNSSKPGVQPSATIGALQFANKTGYLKALAALTGKFTKRDAAVSGQIKQAAISQVRTNEFIQSPWELRELQRVRTGGTVALKLTTVKNNPDERFSQGTSGFSNWIKSNVSCRADTTSPNDCAYTTSDGLLPASFLNGTTPVSLLGASSLNPGSLWFPSDRSQKNQFVALNTCSGCHRAETNTNFVHVSIPRGTTQASQPSGFLRSDLNRRTVNLKNLVCLAAANSGELNLSADGSSDLRLGTSNMVH